MNRYVDIEGAKLMANETLKRPLPIEISQADYDVLSDAEKTNGKAVYYISDGGKIYYKSNVYGGVETASDQDIDDIIAGFDAIFSTPAGVNAQYGFATQQDIDAIINSQP